MEKAIVVISFDGYKDLWDTFFECYEKFFPDCMLPIYLITNHEIPAYPHVTVVTTGDEVSWSRRVRSALQTVRKLRKALKNCVKSDIINI